MICSLGGGSDGDSDHDGDIDHDSDIDGNGDGGYQDHHALYVIVGGVLGVLVILSVSVITTLHCYRNKVCKCPEEEPTDVMPDLTSMQIDTSLENPGFG